MTLAGTGYTPIGPREAKAIQILLSAKLVAEEVEQLRHRITHPLTPEAEVEKCSAAMNDALSRLCNLITLAIANINESASEHFRLSFDVLLDEVRGRLLQMNFHQIQERLVAIRAQVEEALHDPMCRLGLSDRLEAAYGDAVNMLSAMGATEEVGLDPAFLAEIIGNIKALAAIEIRVFKLIDFDAKPVAPPQ